MTEKYSKILGAKNVVWLLTTLYPICTKYTQFTSIISDKSEIKIKYILIYVFL